MLKRLIYQRYSYCSWQHPAIFYLLPIMNTDTIFLIVLTLLSTCSLDQWCFLVQKEWRREKSCSPTKTAVKSVNNYFST